MKDLIVCGVSSPQQYAHECGFNDLVLVIQNLITNLIIFASILTTIAFIYVGLILITSEGSPAKRDRAKGIAWNVLKGYLWILVAWALVYTITTTFLETGYSLLGAP